MAKINEALQQPDIEYDELTSNINQFPVSDNYEHDEYAELFAGLGDNNDEKVLLYRISAGTQKQGILCRLDPGTSVEDIPPRFGGGDYIIKRLRGGMIVKSARLFVEGEPKIELPLIKNEPLQQAGQLDIQGLVNVMQESNKQMIAGLAQILVKNEPPVNTRAQILEEMAVMREVFAPPPAPPANNGVDMLLKGIELAAQLAPKTGETSGMDVLLESIRSFAPAISEVVKQTSVTRIQPAPAKPKQQMLASPAQTQIPTPTDEPSPVIQPTEQDETMIFKYYVDMLVGFAQQGRDPALYADLIADNLTDEKLMSMLNNPKIIDELASVNPGVTENKVWFESLMLELKLIMGLTEPVSINNVVASPAINPVKNAIQSTDGNHNKPS